jgi:hypothetical protein
MNCSASGGCTHMSAASGTAWCAPQAAGWSVRGRLLWSEWTDVYMLIQTTRRTCSVGPPHTFAHHAHLGNLGSCLQQHAPRALARANQSHSSSSSQTSPSTVCPAPAGLLRARACAVYSAVLLPTNHWWHLLISTADRWRYMHTHCSLAGWQQTKSHGSHQHLLPDSCRKARLPSLASHF